MKRVIAFIASLYPRVWRERYGDEFSALLDDVDPSPRAAFDVFTGAMGVQIRTWNLGGIFAISATVACAAFAAEYYFVPVRYVSEGTLRLEGAGSWTQQELDSIRTAALYVESRANLANIHNVYLKGGPGASIDAAIDLMHRRIFVEPVGLPGGAKGFRVSFVDSDPRVAQKVNRDLAARGRTGRKHFQNM